MTPTKLLPIICMVFLLSISLTSALVVIEDIEVYPDQISPGETSRIENTVENIGEDDLEEIVVTINLRDVPFVPKDSSTQEIIEELDEDDDETVSFNVQALNNAGSGIYRIPVVVTYLDDDVEKTREDIISLTVNCEPEISMELIDGLLLKNRKNEISVKIINKGLSDIKFLEVEVDDGSYYNVLSSKYLYIGDIDSDDFDTAEFEIFLKSNAPKTTNFILRLTYKDVTNQEYTKDYKVNLRAYDLGEAYELGLLQKSNTYYYIGGVIVLILAWFVYRKIRKRKLRRR